MEINQLKQALAAQLPAQMIREDAPLSDYTTFRIGGPCDVMLLPKDEGEMVRCVNVLRGLNAPFLVLGNGSNVLIHDEGVRGCVVRLCQGGEEVRVDAQTHTLYVGAGEGMMSVANHGIAHGLGGMEFASGIPGTLGGTVFMNAGAYDHEMKDIVQSVRVLTREGEIKEVDNAAMEFGYRSSAAQRNGWLILGATLKLTPMDKAAIRAKVDDFSRRRRDKQPLNFPSAGSTFKRPNGFYAAKLIDDAGLKGAREGDAQVSELHAGFIVNRGRATCAQVMALMQRIQRTVMDKFGVALVPEVRLIGPQL